MINRLDAPLRRRARFRQRGAVLLLLVFALALGTAGGVLERLSKRARGPAPAHAVTRDALRDARRALLLWVGKRISRGMGDARIPPGLLPYPDRNADGNYDGVSDCVSRDAYLGNAALRLGRLPYRGWEQPCRQALAASEADRLAVDALNLRDAANEVLWFAAARAALDQLETQGPPGEEENLYPEPSPGRLARSASGWLAVCAQDGRLITDQAAIVILAPGSALPAQRRAGAAPAADQFLDRYALRGRPPCDDAAESNADGDEIFIANTGGGGRFNDELRFVTRQELATEMARALAEHLTWRYLMPYLDRAGRFPEPADAAAGADPTCRPGLLSGALPLAGGDCHALARLPEYYLHRDRALHRQIRYSVSADGREARLSFDGCAIEFRLHPGALGASPGQC